MIDVVLLEQQRIVAELFYSVDGVRDYEIEQVSNIKLKPQTIPEPVHAQERLPPLQLFLDE